MSKNVILRKSIMIIPTMLIISVMAFAIIYYSPGSPGELFLKDKTGRKSFTEEEIKKMDHILGVDKGFIESYTIWIKDVAKGDLGTSITYGEPVLGLFLRRFTNSLNLTLIAMFVYLLVGIPMGIFAGFREGGVIDSISRFWSTLTMAIPSFWIGIIVVWIFTLKIRILPTVGFYGIYSLIIPGIMMGLLSCGDLMRILRNRVISILNEEYILSARAMGLSEWKVIWVHVFKNTLATLISTLILACGFIIVGSIIVEQIFSIPGIGSLLMTGISKKDYQLISGCVLLLCAVISVLNLAADIIYPIIDKRHRYETG